MHHFVSHIVLTFTWFFYTHSESHTNAWIIVIYRGVIFFPLFSFSCGSFSLSYCIHFDFGTFLFHSTAQVKWSKPKNMTGTRCAQAQPSKRRKKNLNELCCRIQMLNKKDEKLFSGVALEKRFFIFVGPFPVKLYLLLRFFFAFSLFFRKCYYTWW